MVIVLDAFIAISDAESFSSVCLQVALYYHPLKSFIGVSSSGTDELSLFPPSLDFTGPNRSDFNESSDPNQDLVWITSPISMPISLALSLSFWSSSTPANIWWGDKTSSSVSARHSRMEMAVTMQRRCCKSFFWSIHTCCNKSIQAYGRGTLTVMIHYFGYFCNKLLWFKVLEFMNSNARWKRLCDYAGKSSVIQHHKISSRFCWANGEPASSKLYQQRLYSSISSTDWK